MVHRWHHGYPSGWGYGLAALLLLGVVVMIALLAVLVYHQFAARRPAPVRGPAVPPPAPPGPPAAVPAPAAEQLLAERYARGEIDDEEYRRRLDVLRQHRRE
ncbi:SHOCT domain-containing protein [Kitasatospora sp. NPDC048540]|uniref:SHOCT domain-containing protein n=1 Tax=unclassified Kitasatospora TaxID=2633591 RepID=UPI00053AC916|nr:SHOCT domain-containing protein [Kitasatospora sp. MBT63]